MRGNLPHCQQFYAGQVTKVCHICWTSVDVCPTCFHKFEKIVCASCVAEAIKDDCVDSLKELVDKT